MDPLLGLGAPGARLLAEALGPAAARLAAAAARFRDPYAPAELRRALLRGHPWLLVPPCGDDDAAPVAVRCRDGLLLPWPGDGRADAVLAVPELGVLIAAGPGGGLRAREAGDGTERWCQRTGAKLLPPLFYVSSARAVGAGTFDGVFLWDAGTGAAVWEARTALPVDRVWHLEQQGLIVARASEVLGLQSELMAWRLPPRRGGGATGHEPAWTRRTAEMIVALAACASSLFVRIGKDILALRAQSGEELWRLREESLPRLPTQPTFVLAPSEGGVLCVGVGSRIHAWSATTSQSRFVVEAPGQLLRLRSQQDHSLLIAVVRGAACEVVSWDLRDGRRLHGRKPALLGAEVTDLTSRCQVAYFSSALGLGGALEGCEDDTGCVEAWNASSGEQLWCVERACPVVCLRLSLDGRALFAGGLGEVVALSAPDGSPLWMVGVPGLARGLVQVGTTELQRLAA